VLHPPAPVAVTLGIGLAPQADDESQAVMTARRIRHDGSSSNKIGCIPMDTAYHIQLILNLYSAYSPC